MKFASILFVCLCGLVAVGAHPTVTFSLTFTDVNGRTPAPNLTAGTEQTFYFTLQDQLRNYTTIDFANIMMMHNRYIHVLIMSFDWETTAHIHPDDFKVMTVNNTHSVFMLKANFPKAGSWSFAMDFLYQDPISMNMREGVALEDMVVYGTPPMDPIYGNSTFNYTSTNSFTTHPINDSDIYLGWIDINTNEDYTDSGYIAVLRVAGQSNATNTTGLPVNTGENIHVQAGVCTSIYLDVYTSDMQPAPLTSIMSAAVHFTISNRDNAVYHAHGMYRDPGTDIQDVVTMMNGMTMDMMMSMQSTMLTDPMFNMTMDGSMIGIATNGTLNCFSDVGVVMQSMGGMMDMNVFYGPETFSSVMGIFNFPDTGHWRLFAWMKLKLNDGTERLIVPSFGLLSYSNPLPPDQSSSEVNGAATLTHNLFVAILSMLIITYFA